MEEEKTIEKKEVKDLKCFRFYDKEFIYPVFSYCLLSNLMSLLNIKLKPNVILHSVKIDGKEVSDLISAALFSKVFNIDISNIASSKSQSSLENDYLYNSSSNNVEDNNYIDGDTNTLFDEEYNEPNIDDTNDNYSDNDYDETIFYQSDTLTPEQAKEIVKNYLELSDNAVTYMPENNFGADTTYQYAFRLRLPMTDGSDGLYTMWILVEDDTGLMYWGTWNNDYLVPSEEPIN